MYNKYIISYRDCIGWNFISHKVCRSLTSSVGSLLRKNYFIWQFKLSCLFIVDVIVRFAKCSQFEDHDTKEEKNSNVQIMKPGSRYKGHKGSDITKIRFVYKFVEIRVSLNFTKPLKFDMRYSDSCFTNLNFVCPCFFSVNVNDN